MVHIPSGCQPQAQDAIHWTIVCLTPPSFWPSPETYAISESPSLRAQSLHYVAKALGVVASRWLNVLRALEELVDNGNVLREPHRLQDILFDDDAFSISKRYFWAVNMVHEMINLLDDNIEKLAQYRRTTLTPFQQTMEAKVEEDWQEKAQATFVRAEKEATEACAEPELIRRAFQEKQQRITVMRDGVSI